MRITSGNARGIWLNSPKGDSTRPATDAARQAIFSSIGDAIIGSRVLDIFAGTGAYGLEAASRGASEILFVESDKKALDALKSNVYAVERALSGAEKIPHMRIAGADCFKFLRAEFGAFDFVFADPPYAIDGLETIPAQVFAAGVVNPGGYFILEHPGSCSFADEPFFVKERKYGNVHFSFFEAPAENVTETGEK